MPSIVFVKKYKRKGTVLSFFLVIFFLNYIYGNYVINYNKVNNQKHFKNNEQIYVKIVSPNFDLKYNLSEKETFERIKKLIMYSDIEKNKKNVIHMA